MKVSKISANLIKPHTPTPQNLKNYYISFLDKIMMSMNFSVILFYKSKPENDMSLQESLAKTLVQFYPLAGRYIKDDHCIDCSDQGAELVEAKAQNDVVLMDVVAKADADQLKDLLPDQYFRVEENAHDPLLSIQVTHFPCGGLAIAISVSHRVFDAASLGTFIAAWSNVANDRDSNKILITPSFDLPLLLPYNHNEFGVDQSSNSSTKDHNIVIKRLIIDKEALTSLRSKLKPRNGKTISGVRVVCAIIAKAMIGVDRAKNGEVIGDFLVGQLVNMRGRTIPPQPEHSCGNLAIPMLTQRVVASEAMEIGVDELVDVIGDGVRKSIVDHAENISPSSLMKTVHSLIIEACKPQTNIIVFTDWSKFRFYEANFGFGKPVWTSIGPQQPDTNTTVIMGNKEGDGIEAWVHLNPSDMSYFEQDEEIKIFIS